jgi:hypothetical protein
MLDWKTSAGLDDQLETYREGKGGFTIWKGFKHGGTFPICTSISLEIVVAEKAMDLEERCYAKRIGEVGEGMWMGVDGIK